MVQSIGSATPVATAYVQQGKNSELPKKGADSTSTLESAGGSNEAKQTWGECITSWVMMPVNAMTWVVRKLVCCATLGYCCNDNAKADPKDVLSALKDAQDKAGKAEDKEAKKAVIQDALAQFPGVKAEWVARRVEDEYGSGEALKEVDAKELSQFKEDQEASFDKQAERGSGRLLGECVDIFQSIVDAAEKEASTEETSA